MQLVRWMALLFILFKDNKLQEIASAVAVLVREEYRVSLVLEKIINYSQIVNHSIRALCVVVHVSRRVALIVSPDE